MGVYAPPATSPRASAESTVREAMGMPIGSPSLGSIARGARRVCIVVDDISRPTPVRAILPPVIEELEAAGVDPSSIELLIALGTHRFMTREEIAAKVGPEILRRFSVSNHDWKDPAACQMLGSTLKGVEVWVNRKVMQADLVIGIGQIMPIDISGFTGGGKIIMPGVCGKITIDDMHWIRVDEPDELIQGKRDNVVRAAIDEVARKAGLRFIVNVVMNARGEVIHAVAGDMEEAHRRGCALALALNSVHLPRAADIVVADSHPFDIEFWQANKALDQASHAVRPGGVLILIAPCTEGISATHHEVLRFGYPPLAQIRKMVADGTIDSKAVAIHMAQVSKVAREKATVILVTKGISASDVRTVGLEYAATPQEGLEQAFAMAGRTAKVAVLQGAAQMLPIVD